MSEIWQWDADKQANTLNGMITSSDTTKHAFAIERQKQNPRLPLQRDRDRIVWSKSFKRLAHKTQVFPHLYSDHQRQRMSHSLEVMQLATSISRTLGQNFILCEAIALAHDLGHTPFGHAGEYALDEALKAINMENVEADAKGLSRFSHYEQGLDVVSYLDSVSPNENAEGFHLSPLILEGIFKHTYDHSGDQNKHKSLNFLLKQTKYSEISRDSGTLESQVVRLCDKLSYFISDIEDGLIIGALHLEELKKWNLFDPIFANGTTNRVVNLEDEYRRFRSVRDKILTTIVNSILKKGLEAKADGTLQIMPEKQIDSDMKEIYKYIKKTLFEENILVKKANTRSKHMISCLFCQYLRHPELIPWRFRRKYSAKQDNKFFKRLCELYLLDDNPDTLTKHTSISLKGWFGDRKDAGESNCPTDIANIERRTIADIICVKDYIAGMTDNYAEQRFIGDVDCYQSKVAWEKQGMDKSTYFETVSVKRL